jgi:hypothetical protein
MMDDVKRVKQIRSQRATNALFQDAALLGIARARASSDDGDALDTALKLVFSVAKGQGLTTLDLKRRLEHLGARETPLGVPHEPVAFVDPTAF